MQGPRLVPSGRSTTLDSSAAGPSTERAERRRRSSRRSLLAVPRIGFLLLAGCLATGCGRESAGGATPEARTNAPSSSEIPGTESDAPELDAASDSDSLPGISLEDALAANAPATGPAAPTGPPDDPQIAVTRTDAPSPPPGTADELTVELVDDRGAPLAGLWVRATFAPRSAPTLPPERPRFEPSTRRSSFHAAPPTTVESPSDARGIARLRGLPAGRVPRVDVLGEERAPLFAGSTSRDTRWRGNFGARLDWRCGRRLDALEPNEHRTLRVVVPDRVAIAGRVLDQHGEPIEGLELWIGAALPDVDAASADEHERTPGAGRDLEFDGNPLVESGPRIAPRELDRLAVCFTGADGRFAREGLPAGAWWVAIARSVGNARRAPEERAFPLALLADVSGGGRGELEFSTSVGGLVRGVARDRSGAGLGGREIELRCYGIAGQLIAHTDANGLFQFRPAPPGAFRLADPDRPLEGAPRAGESRPGESQSGESPSAGYRPGDPGGEIVQDLILAPLGEHEDGAPR